MKNTIPHTTPYTYLFRTWKTLLTTAQTLASKDPENTKLWVYDYDKQMNNIVRLHERLQWGKAHISTDSGVDDDLPMFLKKLSSDELQSMMEAIESCRVYQMKHATIKLYTIHSFKGMEDDVVRVSNDVSPQHEPNLYYVALTRGKKHVYIDHIDSSLVQHAAPPQPPVQLNAPPFATHNMQDTNKLMDTMKQFRSEVAKSQSIPAYCVLDNKTLEAIVLACPQTIGALHTINGIGKQKLEKYGNSILHICQAFAPNIVESTHPKL